MKIACCIAVFCIGAVSGGGHVTIRKFKPWGPERGSVEPLRLGVASERLVAAKQNSCSAPFAAAIEKFAEWVNSVKGGVKVNGVLRPIEVVIVDHSQSDSQAANHVIDRLVQEETVGLVIGPCSSTFAGPIAKATAKIGDEALLLSPIVSDDDHFQDQDLIFSIAAFVNSTWDAPLKMIEETQPGVITNISIISLRTSGLDIFGHNAGRCDELQSKAEAIGRKVVSTEYLDWAEICGQGSSCLNLNKGPIIAAVERMFAQSPTVVAACVPDAICLHLLDAARERKLSPAMFFLASKCAPEDWHGGGPLQSREYLKRWAIELTGIYPGQASEWTKLSAQDTKNIASRNSQSKVWGDISVLAWTTAEVLLASVEAADSSEPVQVAAAMRSLRIRTAHAQVEFDSNGQNKLGMLMVQQKGPGTAIVENLKDTTFPVPSWKNRVCYESPQFPGAVIHKDCSWGLDQDGMCVICALTTPPQISVYDQFSGSRQCSLCSAGKHARFYGHHLHAEAICTGCEPGKIALDDGSCQDCEVGKAATLRNFCDKCMPGSHAENPGSPVCLACPVGKYSDDIGAATCLPCAAGRFSPFTGAARCEYCSIGLYTGSTGSSACALCPVGKVANSTGRSSCYECNRGTFSSEGAQDCVECAIGRYQAMSGQTECNIAGNGMARSEGGTGQIYGLNLHGFWYDAKSQKNDFCRFGTDQCLSGHKCAEGHAGRNCMSCLPATEETDGYFRNPISHQCEPCMNRFVNLAILVILWSCAIACWIAIARFVILATMNSQTISVICFKQFLIFIVTQRAVNMILSEAIGEIALSAGALETNFFWVVASFSRLPSYVQGVLPTETRLVSLNCLLQVSISVEDWNNLANAMHYDYLEPWLASSLKALKMSHMQTELRYMIVWAALPGVKLVIIYTAGFVLLHRALYKTSVFQREALDFYRSLYRKSFKEVKSGYVAEKMDSYLSNYYHKLFDIWRPAAHASTYFQYKYIRLCNFSHFVEESQPVFLVVYFVLYSSVAQNLIRASDCVIPGHFGEEKVHLYLPELVCGEHEHLIVIGSSMTAAWLILPPLFVLFRLWLVRSRVNTPAVKRIWGLVADGYRSNCWWWEFVAFIRKGSMTAVVVLPIDAGSKLNICIFVNTAFAIMQLTFTPYESRRNNILNRLEWYGFGVAFSTLALVKFAMIFEDMSFLFFAVLMIDMLFFSYFFMMVFLIVRSYLRIAFSAKLPPIPAKGIIGSVQARLQEFDAMERWCLPYVAFDNNYAWLSFHGYGGDDALPPYFPKGSDALTFPGSWPNLSSCAGFFGDVAAPADELTRMQAMNAIRSSVENIVAISGAETFSISIIEFVVRAAFMTHAKEVKCSISNANPTDEDEIQEVFADKASHIQQDLRTADWRLIREKNTARISGFGTVAMTKSLERFTKKKANTTWMDESSSSSSSSSSNSEDLATNARSVARVERAMNSVALDVEQQLLQKFDLERFGKMVFDSMSPDPFNRGITFPELEGALSLVTRLSSQELRMWMDVFEMVWRAERVDNVRSLERMVGGYKDAEVTASPADNLDANMTINLRWVRIVAKLRRDTGAPVISAVEIRAVTTDRHRVVMDEMERSIAQKTSILEELQQKLAHLQGKRTFESESHPVGYQVSNFWM